MTQLATPSVPPAPTGLTIPVSPYKTVAELLDQLGDVPPERVLLDPWPGTATEADVIALQLDGGTWPDGRPTWRRRLQDVWATRRFHVAFCHGQTVVLYRGPETSVPCPAWEALVTGPAGPAAP